MSLEVAPGAGTAGGGDVLDRKRIEALFAHTDALISFLTREHRISIDVAEEVTASVFAELLEAASTGAPRVVASDAKALPYLKEAVRRAAFNFRSNLANQDQALGNEAMGAGSDMVDPAQRRPLSIIDAEQKWRTAKTAWDRLPQRTRQLLTLVDFEDVPLAEAARTLGLEQREAYDLYEETHRDLARELGRTWSTFIVPAPKDLSKGGYKPRTRRAALEHIDDLPKEQRDVLRATHVDELPEMDAARRLGLSPEGLRERLQRANELLSQKTGCTVDEIRAALANRRRV